MTAQSGSAWLKEAATVVRPGDTLILRSVNDLGENETEAVRRIVSEALPDDAKFLVVGPDFEVFVQRTGDEQR